jgi:hypothetical protein
MSNTNLYIPELGDDFIDYRQQIWGNSYTWSWERPITQVKYLVIHHTVTSHDATPDDIALLHKARGWGGIGYHFLITKDGKVWYVGDIGTARANVLNMNEKVIGISLIGDFTQYLPSDQQIMSAHKLCQFLIDVPSVPVNNWDQVVGHKELQATQCPGSSWDKSQSGDMYWRIKTGTPYTPPPEVEQQEVYKIVYKGEELGRYDYNPTDKITDLTNKLKITTDDLSQKVLEVAEYQSALLQQEQDNAELLTQNTLLRTERDDALVDVARQTKLTAGLEQEVERLRSQIATLEQKIKNLESDSPLSAYGGWQLISLGIKKLTQRT